MAKERPNKKLLQKQNFYCSPAWSTSSKFKRNSPRIALHSYSKMLIALESQVEVLAIGRVVGDLWHTKVRYLIVSKTAFLLAFY